MFLYFYTLKVLLKYSKRFKIIALLCSVIFEIVIFHEIVFKNIEFFTNHVKIINTRGKLSIIISLNTRS